MPEFTTAAEWWAGIAAEIFDGDSGTVLKPAYAALTDRPAIAAALRAKTVPVRQPLQPILDVVMELRRRDKWLDIVDVASNPQHPAYRAGRAAVDLNNDVRAQNVDLDDPVFRTMLGGLTATSVIDAETEAVVLALGDTTEPWDTRWINALDINAAYRSRGAE